MSHFLRPTPNIFESIPVCKMVRHWQTFIYFNPGLKRYQQSEDFDTTLLSC